MLKYQKGYIFNGFTFVVKKEDVHNATDNMFVEATALLPDGWVSAGERLPPKGSDDWYNIVLTKQQGRAKNIVRVGYWDGYHKRFYGFDAPSDYDVTHWMPLPEPPKEVDHESD